MELANTLRNWQPGLKTSRNLFANVLLEAGSEAYLAQNYQDFLASYDLISLMAMPKFENITNESQFYEDLVAKVRAEPTGLKKTIFQLQAVDWRIPQPIPATELRQTMVMLKTKGVDNLAYYPDDFIQGIPELEQIIHGMSLAETPWGPSR